MSATLVKVWAIARMTLLEASRRKVFVILLLFVAALLSSLVFFPSVEMSGRLRLMEVWALRAAAIFTAIVALFLAGFSLPADFEHKRIYLLVSKPVSKAAIFFGRFLGFVMLLAVFIGTMGVVTILFIRAVQLLAGPAFPALVAYPRVGASEFAHENGVQHEGDPLYTKVDNLGALIWRFRGLKRSDFPEKMRAEFKLSIGSPQDRFRASGKIRLEVRHALGRKEDLEQFINTNEEKEYAFPVDVIGPDGRLEVVARCVDSDSVIMASKESLVLYEKSIGFEANFARGLGLLLLQSLIVLSVTLAASTFVSAPVSILLGILLYLVGTVHGFVLEGTRDIDRSLQEAREGLGKKARTPENIPKPMLDFSTAVSRTVLAIVPDFDDFDFSKWLLKDRSVSWREIGTAARRALLTILVPALMGMLVMIFKDFG